MNQSGNSEKIIDSGRDLDPSARRRLLLKSLAKGSAGLAAGLPLASQATRSYVINDGSRNVYCSASGFQSAAVSAAPQGGFTTCSAFLPSHFVAPAVAVPYTMQGGSKVSVDNRATATALGITLVQLDLLLSVNGTGELGVIPANDATNYVIYKGNGATACLKTTLTNLPIGPYKQATFASIFGGTTTGRFLDLLKPVAVGSPYPNEAYFAAAYLSCVWDAGVNTGDIPFDADYVVEQYAKFKSGISPNALAFFQKLCSKA